MVSNCLSSSFSGTVASGRDLVMWVKCVWGAHSVSWIQAQKHLGNRRTLLKSKIRMNLLDELYQILFRQRSSRYRACACVHIIISWVYLGKSKAADVPRRREAIAVHTSRFGCLSSRTASSAVRIRVAGFQDEVVWSFVIEHYKFLQLNVCRGARIWFWWDNCNIGQEGGNYNKQWQ